tara:strand:+ start:263 stop:436 length:174 start_codon:yes stop_codon:yes gene_type:complete
MGNSKVDRDAEYMKSEYGVEALITDYDSVYDRWTQKKQKELQEVDYEEIDDKTFLKD